jgi:hypothetical protein
MTQKFSNKLHKGAKKVKVFADFELVELVFKNALKKVMEKFVGEFKDFKFLHVFSRCFAYILYIVSQIRLMK